jgi:TonB family protein
MTQTFITPNNSRLKTSANIFAVVLAAAFLFCGSTALSAQSTPEPANSVTVDPNPVDLAGRGRTQAAEVLTDTRGVDFGPYIRQVLQLNSKAWHKLLPQDTGVAPTSQGWTLIRLTIAPDGTISAMHLEDSSHQTALDRAAWSSITSVGKLPPLPKDFNGPNLELRLRFNVSGDAAR